VHTLVSWLGTLPPGAVYLVAGAIVFAETGLIVGLVVPGEATLLCVGFLAYSGILRPITMITVASIAALTGDAVAYAEGRRVGPRLRTGRLGRWVGPRRWTRADALLLRHGGRAVAVGRFIPFVRTLIPRLAGIAGLPYRRVVVWDVLGVVGWVSGSVFAGYIAGSSYARVADVFGRATGAVLLLTLVVAVLVLIGRYLGRHRDPATAFAGRLVRTWPLRGLERWYMGAFRRLIARFGPGWAFAVNLALGVLALLAIGVALTWVIDRLIRHSGFPLVDPLIANWFTAHRTRMISGAASVTLSTLRGSFVVAAVAVVGVALNPRPRVWRTDLLGALGTAGAFIPLLILALAGDWTRPEAGTHALLSNQVTVVTAGLGMLAWMVGRRMAWAAAVGLWLAAVGAVLLVAGASLYLGGTWPSEVVASILMGSLWVLVFMVAWHTRSRLRAEQRQRTQARDDLDRRLRR
jgi:membrane protein DedA with SNARE-associated domain